MTPEERAALETAAETVREYLGTHTRRATVEVEIKDRLPVRVALVASLYYAGGSRSMEVDQRELEANPDDYLPYVAERLATELGLDLFMRRIK